MAIPQMKKKKVEMVETEMFRMVPKAAQEKFEKEAGIFREADIFVGGHNCCNHSQVGGGVVDPDTAGDV